jgi:hypothetical protein
MLGHKWVPAEGTVTGSAREQMELPGRHGMHWVEVYDLEVRTPDGQTVQARVPGPGLGGLTPGTVVRVETNARTGEIRLHPDWHTAVIRNGPPRPAAGGPGGTGLDLMQLFGGGAAAGDPATGGVAGGTDMAEVLRAVMSGDPAARAAAKEQLRQLAQSRGQGAGTAFAFGDLTVTGPAGGFGGGPAPFTSPQAPPASPSDRLAALEQLLERGQVSQAEFDTMREHILGEL